MKRLLLLFLLLLSSGLVHAGTVPATIRWNLANINHGSIQAACDYWVTTFTSSGWTYQNLTVEANELSGYCRAQFFNANGANQGQYGAPVSISPSCQVGFTLQDVGGTTQARYLCSGTCPAGTVENPTTHSCETPPNQCEQYKGQSVSVSLNCSSTDAPAAMCMPNGCAANIINSAVGYKKATSCYFGIANGKYTGDSCNGEPNSSNYSNPTQAPQQPTDSPETDCLKSGKTFGSVNGVTVCVPKGSSGGAPTSSKNESTTTTTQTDAQGNQSSSSSSTSSELSQDGDAVITKETKKDEDGKTTTVETETTKDDFCAKNPNNAICKPQPDDVCEENPDLPQCMKVGEPDAGGLIETQARAVSYNPVQITSGGSCPPDKTVSVAGRSMTFSYTWLCQYASMFKPFMLAFAYLSAAMFLFSGLRGANT